MPPIEVNDAAALLLINTVCKLTFFLFEKCKKVENFYLF